MLLFLAGLAGWQAKVAFDNERLAIEQRNIAEQQRQLAQQQRDRAERTLAAATRDGKRPHCPISRANSAIAPACRATWCAGFSTAAHALQRQLAESGETAPELRAAKPSRSGT